MRYVEVEGAFAQPKLEKQGRRGEKRPDSPRSVCAAVPVSVAFGKSENVTSPSCLLVAASASAGS